MHRAWFLLVGLALAAGAYLLVSAPGVPEPSPRPVAEDAPAPAEAASAPAPAAADDAAPGDGVARQGDFPVTIIRIEEPPLGRKPPGYDAAARGWDALSAGDDEAALAAFKEAAAQGATDVSFGMAAAYHRLGRTKEALAMARKAAVERPDSGQVWKLLGVLRHDTDDLEGAVAAWERAQALQPDPQVAEWLDATRPDLEVEQNYLVGQTRHFRVHFEGPTDAYLANHVLDILETAYADVGLVLGYYPDKMVDTILYTQQEFFDVTRSPSWAGGIFDGKVRLPVAGAEPDPEELKRIVTHEYVHAAITLATDRAVIPTWFQEGVAMNLEGGDRTAWARARVAQNGSPVPLSRLSGSFMSLSQGDAEVGYAEGFLLVRSLLDRFGQFRLADLIAQARTTPFDQAFLRVYGETPAQAQARALEGVVPGA